MRASSSRAAFSPSRSCARASDRSALRLRHAYATCWQRDIGFIPELTVPTLAETVSRRSIPLTWHAQKI